MTQSKSSKWALSKLGIAGALVLSSTFSAGCNANGSDPSAASAEGTITLPLVTVTNGSIYRLNNALVYVYGPGNYAYLSSTDAPDETALKTTLATGNYSAWLQPGWSLQKQNGQGTFDAVRATLSSNSDVPFQIWSGATTTVTYDFQSDGSLITFGSGNMNIAVKVTEVAPICASFGTDCGDGNWCPPTELTGSAPSCVAAGTVPVGQPCSSPTSCTANASCIDLGAGPVCVALCGSNDFGQPCGSGGICEPTGASYGMCR